MKKTLNIITLFILPFTAFGSFIIDGSRTGDTYGSAVSVQTVQTQFGDNFSELNAAYGTISGGNLHLMLTGNLENNFNKLNIFIDSVDGGENTLTSEIGNGGSNPANDGWANKYAGFTFDSAFTADFMLIARRGNFGGDRFDLDFTSVGNDAAVESYGDVFGGSDFGANTVGLGSTGIQVAYDGSNVAGILGGTGAADPLAAAAVTTGLELLIPLSAIGNPSGEIRVSAMVNAGNHDFLSNQFLGGLTPPQSNLGGDGAGNFTGDVSGINLDSMTGDQFFVVIPEPASVSLIALVGGGIFFTRRFFRV
jgi:hypothetical protein